MPAIFIGYSLQFALIAIEVILNKKTLGELDEGLIVFGFFNAFVNLWVVLSLLYAGAEANALDDNLMLKLKQLMQRNYDQ